jgi:hypothetical protein
MYNDYYLLKKIEDNEAGLSYATAMDSFTYKGEVVGTPYETTMGTTSTYTGLVGNGRPQVGDKVIFLKGSGEDVGDLKAVKFEDIIMKI